MFSFSSSLRCFTILFHSGVICNSRFPVRKAGEKPYNSRSRPPPEPDVFPRPVFGAHRFTIRFLVGCGRHASGAFPASRPRRLRRLYTGLPRPANRSRGGPGPPRQAPHQTPRGRLEQGRNRLHRFGSVVLVFLRALHRDSERPCCLQSSTGRQATRPFWVLRALTYCVRRLDPAIRRREPKAATLMPAAHRPAPLTPVFANLSLPSTA